MHALTHPPSLAQPVAPDAIASAVVNAAGQAAPIDLLSLVFDTLQALVAHDSASDERSTTIPSTPGQRKLGAWIADTMRSFGAAVEIDAHGNVLGALPGSGAGAKAPPIAMMAHLDTARGTVATPALRRVAGWRGDRVPYTDNAAMQVDIATYPSLAAFCGQTLVHGEGRAPFGLDDKLGLTEILTLGAWLAAEGGDRPPLLLIARPDEEIGCMAAVEGLSEALRDRGVRLGWTIDGIAPFEINVENFDAAMVRVSLPEATMTAAATMGAAADVPLRTGLRLSIGGVNTHGATAKAEGHRPATRLAAELLGALDAAGLGPEFVAPCAFGSDSERDCDGVLDLGVAASAPADAEARVAACAEAIIAPHRPRGASLGLLSFEGGGGWRMSHAVTAALRLVRDVLADPTVLPVAAEDSDGRQGYSQPFRILPIDGGVRLDVRLRDFDPALLDQRAATVAARCPAGAGFERVDQYINMGPQLRGVSALIEWPEAAARRLGLPTVVQPIRGGTGVDPFLSRGVAIGNLGTGYFAPESEKELTSLEMAAAHVRWLAALIAIAATAGAEASPRVAQP